METSYESALEDTEDFLKWKKLCRKECEKNNPDTKFIKNILKETFVNRKEEREQFNKGGEFMVSSVLKQWPCFQYGDYVCLYFNYFNYSKVRNIDFIRKNKRL